MVEIVNTADATVVAARNRVQVQQSRTGTAPACRLSSITRDRERAEYKQVTVVFADVVRSMEIASALGAERLREIMSEVFDLSAVVVRRYGGTVDKFTGDGIMALFGAPVALEDHVLRGCSAAVGIQDEVQRLAVEVQRHHHIALGLRVGLSSGRVVAGQIGSAAIGYTAIGEPVGMAQRMVSIARPGGVTLSESTARLLGDGVALGEPELVEIKGGDAPVLVRPLLGMKAGSEPRSRHGFALFGRRHELGVLSGMLDRSIGGVGCVAGVVGPAGIGKSRITRELALLAKSRGAQVYAASCEAHASEVPFYVVARMLRAMFGLRGLDDEAARAQVRARLACADPEDLLLLDDFIGIGDTTAAMADINPDARRRRLARLVHSASLARETPALFIIEDAHWIDAASETLFAEFLSVVPQTRSMMLVTYRPEYRGALSRIPGARTVSLAELNHSESLAFSAAMLGPHPSVADLVTRVADNAAGNPFFTAEIVRDLAERGVLGGDRGAYVSRANVTLLNVPATVEATIAARIDRLGSLGKETLNAAAAIGSQFEEHALTSLLGHTDLAELIEAELIEQVQFAPRAKYAFRHPLIRTVAYESQLRSERAELHRRLAGIEQRDPTRPTRTPRSP